MAQETELLMTWQYDFLWLNHVRNRYEKYLVQTL